MSDFLPPELPVKPLTRIAPSKFLSFMNCRLRACWESAHVDGLLPSSPASHIGTAIHRVIESIGRSEIDIGTNFDLIWRKYIEEEEQKIKDSWIEQHFVPLSNSDPNYEVKKRQCKMIVDRMICRSVHKSEISCLSEENGNEVWLQTDDGKVGGYVDAIISRDRGEVIEDFKTGSIFESGQEGADSLINRQYELQLKLYAALFHSTYKKWPKSLEIVGLDGIAHCIEFTPEECSTLLKEAYDILNETNLIISISESGQDDVYEKLSSPSPENCRFCLYRPGCPSYWKLRDADKSRVWPNDAKGQIIEIKNLGNGLIFIRLKLDNSEIISIRGLHPERHLVLKRGINRIAIFSMISSKVEGNFREGKYTTIYTLA